MIPIIAAAATAPLARQVLPYVVYGVVGIAMCVGVLWALGTFVKR